MNESIGVSLIGCGAVGSAVAEMLLNEGANLAERSGVRPVLRRVLVRDSNQPRGVSLPDGCLTVSADDLFNDPETRIVVELAGGTDTAADLILRALASGHDVVTANKALLALRGPEIFAAARRAGRCVAFEAAVCAGVPVIESLRRGLIANRIDAVMGILNGTSNYVLSRMLDDRIPYAAALDEARRLGYAEANPALDVQGTDAAHKLTILATMAMRRACDFHRIAVCGIDSVELDDLLIGRELGYVCKLLAAARRFDDGLHLSVRPTFIPLHHPLAAVSGPFNAVSYHGQHVGHVLLYGRGAGAAPTASAVVADVIDVALGNAGRTFDRTRMLPDQLTPADYRPAGEILTAFYLRMHLADRPGGIGYVATELGRAGINIASIVQRPLPAGEAARPGDDAVPVIVTTGPAPELAVQAALAAIERLPAVRGRTVALPILAGDGQ